MPPFHFIRTSLRGSFSVGLLFCLFSVGFKSGAEVIESDQVISPPSDIDDKRGRDYLITDDQDLEKSKFHFLINDVSATSRYRIQTNEEGLETHNQLQLRLNLDATLYFFSDRVRIDLQGGTGDNYGSSWSNTGIGRAEQDIDLNLRRLSLTLKLSDFIEVGAGSFAPEYGAGSQVSSLDADGYVMGYKVKAVVLGSDIILTGGSLGDYNKPNVFSRLDGLNSASYFQAMIHRSLSQVISLSLDYTRHDRREYGSGTDNVFRSALSLNVKEFTPALDRIQIEHARGTRDVEGKPYDIFAVSTRKTVEKVWKKRDLEISTSFLYLSSNPENLVYPTHSVHFGGAFYRIQVRLLNLFNSSSNKDQWNLYTRWNHSLENSEHWRLEFGTGVAF